MVKDIKITILVFLFYFILFFTNNILNNLIIFIRYIISFIKNILSLNLIFYKVILILQNDQKQDYLYLT